MVGGATHPQQQQSSQLAPPSSSTTTEEEEFLKRNTDCVYFLASPLTCKKGSECEYRHSDIARVNPRDCWYWLNGNCLNPKCGFRHPPLDGLLGAEVPTPVAPSVPQPPSKQGVACIFFQKGFCLKGHLCPFLHGPPNILNNKTAQPTPPNPATKPPKTAPAPPEKQAENTQKAVEFPPPQRKQAFAPARNGGTGTGTGGSFSLEKTAPPVPFEEPARYRPAAPVPPPVMNEFPANRSNHVSDNDSILNGKDPDEYSREPTPGFDVLVDNELGESEYYHNEEQFGRSNSHDFDIDRDMYSEQRDYDYNERYAWDDHHHRASSERKRYPRDESPDRFDQSDLRHRISKQRRGNVNVTGLRSVVSREHSSDRRDRDRDRDRDQRRTHHRPDQGGSGPGNFSSRLRGRIKIPARSVSPGEHRSRYSPCALSSHGRLRDRIKGRSNEDYDNDRKFSGPRRLSELKRGYEDQKDDPKRKHPKLETQQSEDTLSFEGPKPLSEILKRKRGVESTVLDTRVSSMINEDSIKPVTNKDNNHETESGLMELKEMKETESGLMESGVNVEADKEDEDEMLDKELEAYDHRDGEYDYEQIDGEDYNLDEGEEGYMDGEDEYGKKESDVYS